MNSLLYDERWNFISGMYMMEMRTQRKSHPLSFGAYVVCEAFGFCVLILFYLIYLFFKCRSARAGVALETSRLFLHFKK